MLATFLLCSTADRKEMTSTLISVGKVTKIENGRTWARKREDTLLAAVAQHRQTIRCVTSKCTLMAPRDMASRFTAFGTGISSHKGNNDALSPCQPPAASTVTFNLLGSGFPRASLDVACSSLVQ